MHQRKSFERLPAVGRASDINQYTYIVLLPISFRLISSVINLI